MKPIHLFDKKAESWQPIMTMRIDERVQQAFRDRFGTGPCFLIRAPGRVNLIGEHTDYNDGFVMPLAIDRATWIALKPRVDRRVSLYSLDFTEEVTFELDALERTGPLWAEYVKSVAWALGESGHRLTGWDGVMAGDVPIGAGLSSSAALELATSRAFAMTSGIDWEPIAMALIAQRAENVWVGVNCGIMDQMISATGLADHAVLIDCRSMRTTHVRLPTGSVIVVMDTATRRGLVDSTYNERRSQCEQAARFFGVGKLRDVGRKRFADQAGALPDVIRRRAAHVISENARVLEAARVMRTDNAIKLGRLLNASHDSLRDDFQVSSFELDMMVDIARNEPVCYGARMTGAGFGGCAVALVRASGVAGFVESVSARYEYRTNIKPSLYVTGATDGAQVFGCAP